SGGARLAFGFDPGAAPAVELRAQLRRAGRPVSEVWLYRWTA
ncbi:MAG: glucan biosynthesis protein, partial [Gemmobacter sp.]